MTCTTRRATSKIARTTNQKARVQARGKGKTQREEGLNILYCSHVCPGVRWGSTDSEARQQWNNADHVSFALCHSDSEAVTAAAMCSPHSQTERI